MYDKKTMITAMSYNQLIFQEIRRNIPKILVVEGPY